MKRTALAVLCLAVTVTSASAQGAQAPAPIEGVTWYLVSYAKFKAGMIVKIPENAREPAE